MERAFNVAAPPPQDAVSDLDVYIDDSKSMRGYVAANPSNYRQKIEHVLQNSTIGLNTRVFRLSDFADKSSLLLREILDLPFYNADETRLSRMIDQAAATEGRMVLLISDMVQSDKTSDRRTLTQSLRNVIRKMPEMRLLAFRSSFRGTYAIESQSADRRQLALVLDENVDGAGRPFYVLATGPNRASIDRLENIVLRRTKASEQFVPTDSPMHVTDVAYAPGPNEAEGWEVASKDIEPLPTGALRAYVAVEKVGRNGSQAFPLRLAGTVRLPFEHAARLDIQIRRAGQDGAAPNVNAAKATSELDEESGELRILYEFPEPSTDKWDVYQVRITGGEGNLSSPEWVGKWHTNNDSLRENATMTYQLDTLVSALRHGVTEKVLISEQYIAVRRK